MTLIDLKTQTLQVGEQNVNLSNVRMPEKLRILFGSEMGNAELVADNLEEALRAQGLDAECVEMNDQPVEELNELGLVLFVTSTCGEGDLPYTADRFWDELSGDEAPTLSALHFAVLTLGDSGYTYFCEAGAKLDRRLEELGAVRIADRVDLDVNYVDPSEEWIEARVAQLAELDPGDDNRPGVEPIESRPRAAKAGPSQWNRENPFQATVVHTRLLTGSGSAKEIRHYEVDISGSGFAYEPGDSLAIVPHNSQAAVSAFLDVAGLRGDETVDGVTVRDLAERRWELRFPSAILLETLVEQAPDSDFARDYSTAEDSHVVGEDWIRTHSVGDTLRELPAPLPVTTLAAVMGPIRYRAYSVASTPITDPEVMHLTVATQRNAEGTLLPSGIGSGYLADMISVGDKVDAFPLPNRAFRLPESLAAPIIMVGPGVGVAPFRGYLAHRVMQEGAGKSWLFFGDQHHETDFIYEEEWAALLASGALTRLDTAFSRDQAEKIYVQDRMRESGRELIAWLQDGAYFYVCGDGKRMAADVDTALKEIAVAELGEGAGAALLEQLHHDRRYLRDVY